MRINVCEGLLDHVESAAAHDEYAVRRFASRIIEALARTIQALEQSIGQVREDGTFTWPDPRMSPASGLRPLWCTTLFGLIDRLSRQSVIEPVAPV
jgi:hypothetical protein